MKREFRLYEVLLVFCVAALLALGGIALYLILSPEVVDRVPGRGWYNLSDMDLPADSPNLEAAVMGGLYLVNCQRSDGSFNYLYDPVDDSYSTSDNMLRQLGTTYSILLLYKHYPEEIFLEAGELAMEYVEGQVDHIDDELAHIEYGGDSKLGGAALAILCYVVFEKVADDRYGTSLDALGNFIVHSQKENGEFRNYYMWDGKVLTEDDERYHKHTDYYPGEAMLALAFLYEHTGEAKYKECWDGAFDYYYDFYGGERGRYTPFSPWGVGAAQIMYCFDNDSRYVSMSRAMADSVIYGQDQFPDDFGDEEYVGGFYYGRYRNAVMFELPAQYATYLGEGEPDEPIRNAFIGNGTALSEDAGMSGKGADGWDIEDRGFTYRIVPYGDRVDVLNMTRMLEDDYDYHPRANTASKVEPPADFYWMMKQHDLEGDRELYRERMLSACSFLERLQYNSSDADPMPDPRRTYGGVPGGTRDPEVRIDYNQHAIVAWLKAYDYVELEKGILE